MSESGTSAMRIKDGVALVMFAQEFGYSVDLQAAERLIESTRPALATGARNPAGVEIVPRPLLIEQPGPAISVAGHALRGPVRITIYAFGAVSVAYRIPVAGPLDGLVALSGALVAPTELRDDARRRVAALVEALKPAITRPLTAESVEDYTVFAIRALEPGTASAPLKAESISRQLLARILRAEPAALSDEQVSDAVSGTVSYGPDDLAVIDWNAAILIDPDPDATIAALELANTQLLELRFLDDTLDHALEEAYDITLGGSDRPAVLGGSIRSQTRRLARMQVDAASLLQSVGNALKIYGDQHLARIHDTADRRLRLHDWERSIRVKLDALEAIYGKLRDAHHQRRSEILEWIIITLIAVEIVFTLAGLN
jgi:hypothetical protein